MSMDTAARVSCGHSDVTRGLLQRDSLVPSQLRTCLHTLPAWGDGAWLGTCWTGPVS